MLPFHLSISTFGYMYPNAISDRARSPGYLYPRLIEVEICEKFIVKCVARGATIIAIIIVFGNW